MLEKKEVVNQEPQLDPPGAGIPWHQQKLLEYIVAPFVANRTNWDLSEKRFYRLTKTILKEVESLSDEQLTTKMLVPPQQGLEDSSRYWSIAMVLEHLVIVGKGITYVITELTSERAPQGKAETATVKPVGKISAQESLALFKNFCDKDYKKFLGSIQNKNSKLKFRHPWFGNINAKQWFWILPVHHNLHLKQIREIKTRLSELR